MREFTVKIKDLRQNTTHTMSFWARSQRDANVKAIDYLEEELGHDELELR